MFKKILVLVFLVAGLTACASWFSSSKGDNVTTAPDSPTVGSKDSSDFSFGQAASEPTKSAGQNDTKKVASATNANASGV